jgi:hypothetical protein
MFATCSKPFAYDEEAPPPKASSSPLVDKPYKFINTNVNQEDCRSKFMEIIKYYNDVIMTNSLVFSESQVLKAQKMIHEIECERNKLYTPTGGLNNSMVTDSDFFRYILKKIENLQNLLEYQHKQLSYFYTKYKKEYHNVSILVIVLSSTMSLVEGITLLFDPYNKVSPVIMMGMSSTIAITTSILKFRNTKERLEGIIKMKEKIQMCQAKIFTFDKEVKTSLFVEPTPTDIKEDTPQELYEPHTTKRTPTP